MRLASFTRSGKPGWGAVTDQGIVDLAGRTGHATLRAALAAGVDFKAAASGASADCALADVVLTTPVPDAQQILCIGRNYKGHLAEANMKLPEFPSLFIRLHSSRVAHDVPVVRPKLSGDSFSNEDIQIIEVLAPQIGSAIQKANLYE